MLRRSVIYVLTRNKHTHTHTRVRACTLGDTRLVTRLQEGESVGGAPVGKHESKRQEEASAVILARSKECDERRVDVSCGVTRPQLGHVP